MISNGFAYAASSYGAGGLSIKEGIIRTHQLTEYVINNYPVTGKVVLIGMSMGGNIVLELGAKYPDLYDGVLDGFGSKDLIPQYYDKVYYASLTNDADIANALTARGIAVPPFPFAPPVLVAPLSVQLAAFRTFSSQGAEDMVLACGGTPNEKPKAYERISPTYSSFDISIPTITLHGTADGPVPYQQSVEFKDAVVAAGYGSLYRLYTVTGGQHGDSLTSAKIPACFMLLMNWIKNGVAPPETMPW